MNDFIRLNIAFVLPDEVSELAIKLSQGISKEYETYFALDGENYFPHVTIYSPEFPKKNIHEIFRKLEDLVHSSPGLSFFPFVFFAEEKGFVDIEIENTIELYEFQKRVVEELNGFREGHLRDKYRNGEYLSKLSDDEKRNVEKYGYPLVMNLFRPHITLSRLVDESKNKEIVSNLNVQLNPFEVEEIGIFEMGKNGTCTNLVRKFKLNGSTR